MWAGAALVKAWCSVPIDLPDGSMIRLTVARYYTPAGRCIQKPYESIEKYNEDLIDRYNKGLKGLPITVVTHYTSDIVSSGHLYIINLNDKDAEQRNKFIEEMAGLGVATNVHYKPLPMHTGYKKLGFKIEDYPNAYKQFKNVVTLPLHTCLSDEDVDYVIECVKECLK